MPREGDSPDLDPALERWLRGRGVLTQTRTPLVGDLSQRRYVRFDQVGGGTLVLAIYPEALVGVCDRFYRTTGLLTELGIRVPRILDRDCGRGWMLVEDLGPYTLYDLPDLRWTQLEPLFSLGVTVAQRIATLPVDEIAVLNPPLDSALLRRELRQTQEAFLVPEGLLGDPREARRIEDALADLCVRLGAAAPVPCHRDLMARNLIVVGGRAAVVAGGSAPALEALAVLDHQDLRLGPPGYDMASLLNDSLFPPEESEKRLLEQAFGPGPWLDYHRAAAQRTLKAVGSYAVFARRGSDRHRPLIAPTLGRALIHLGKLPEMEPLMPHLERLWRSALG